MYRHFLDGQEIEEPEGFDGALLNKEASDIYFGFMGSGFGISLSQETATLVSNDKFVIDFLRQSFESLGINAKIPYRIEWCGQTVFNGVVDIENYVEHCCEVSFSIRRSADDNFGSRRTIKYGLKASTPCLFRGKFLSGKSSHVLDENLGGYHGSEISTTDYGHYLPLKYQSNTINNGKADSVEDVTKATALFSNTGGTLMPIRVTGSLIFTATTTPLSSYEIILEIRAFNGNVLSSSIQASYTSATIERQVSIDWMGSIPAGAGIYLYVATATGAEVWDFDYSHAGLSIEDPSASVLTSSTHKGLLLAEAFELLRQKMGVNVPLCSDWLEGCGNRYWLTNGYQLRGIDRPLNIDFEWLFVNVSKIFCLGAKMDTTCLRIEKRIDLMQCEGSADFGELEDTNGLQVNGELLYSSVTCGYERWQSNTVYGNDEFCANHTYQTGFTGKSNTLSLQSELIASGYLIEELRRQSFTQNVNSGKDNDLDERIFIVSTVLTDEGIRKAETNEHFTDINGIISPGTAYNLRISPVRNLMRWQEFWAGLGGLTLSAYEGNIGLVSRQTDEACETIGLIDEGSDIEDRDKGFLSWKSVLIEDEVDPQLFDAIDNCVLFSLCNKNYAGIARKVEYGPDVDGGKIGMSVWLLK